MFFYSIYPPISIFIFFFCSSILRVLGDKGGPGYKGDLGYKGEDGYKGDLGYKGEDGNKGEDGGESIMESSPIIEIRFPDILRNLNSFFFN